MNEDRIARIQAFALGVFAILASMGGAESAFAENKIICVAPASSTSKLSINTKAASCEYSAMPLLNQKSSNLSSLWAKSNDPNSSNICVPTSATMALNALVNSPVRFIPQSWTPSHFSGRDFKTQVTQMFNLMGTSKLDGTLPPDISKYASLASNIYGAESKTYTEVWQEFPAKQSTPGVKAVEAQPAAGGQAQAPLQNALNKAEGRLSMQITDLSGIFLLNNDLLISNLLANEVNILSYGHYKANCLNSSRGPICTYQREGGHEVAINGFTRIWLKAADKVIPAAVVKAPFSESNQSTPAVLAQKLETLDTLRIYDPWGGVIQNYSISPLNSVAAQNEGPFGQRTQVLFKAGSFVKIIEQIDGIRTH